MTILFIINPKTILFISNYKYSIMLHDAKITYGDAVDSSNIILYLENKKKDISSNWGNYITTSLSMPNEIISEKLKKILGGISTEATTTFSNSLYSLVKLTLECDFFRIANHDGGDRNLKNQMKNTPDIVIHDFQFINGGTDSYKSDVLQLNSPTHGMLECLRETITIDGSHLLVLNDVLALLDAIIKMIRTEGHTFHLPFITTEHKRIVTKNRIVIKDSQLRQMICETIRRFITA